MRNIFRTVLLLFLIFILLSASLPYNVVAEPYIVVGYLRDEYGVPIANSNITFSGMVYNPFTNDYEVRIHEATTDIKGHYMVVLAVNDPDSFRTGDKLTVSYERGNIEGTREFIIETQVGRDAWFNITHEKKTGFTDSLYSPFGVVTLVTFTSVLFVIFYAYYSSRKDKEDSSQEPKRVERRRRRGLN